MPSRNPIREDEFPARVWPKIDATGDCWDWAGGHNPKGYARLAIEGPAGRMVHRNVWHVLVGPIPDGLTIDHRCRNRGCQNPDHMEVVPNGVNVLRGYGPPARNARRVTCDRGHELVPTGDGWRRCAQCAREYAREYQRAWNAAHPEQRRAHTRAWKARARARRATTVQN
jgi:hypothetical protein